MPHIIVEYSRDLEQKSDISKLITDMHNQLADQGIDKSRIKSRAIALSHVVVGDKGGAGSMVHATLLILEGRDDETKSRYGQALYSIMKNFANTLDCECAATLEIRDMSRDFYYM